MLQRKVCCRTFSLRICFVFLPHVLSSLTHEVYVKCFDVRKLQVCLRGNSSLTRFHIPTRVDSWVWHKTVGICSRYQGGGSSKHFSEIYYVLLTYLVFTYSTLSDSTSTIYCMFLFDRRVVVLFVHNNDYSKIENSLGQFSYIIMIIQGHCHLIVVLKRGVNSFLHPPPNKKIALHLATATATASATATDLATATVTDLVNLIKQEFSHLNCPSAYLTIVISWVFLLRSESRAWQNCPFGLVS
jgi:hypothetical protein